MVVFLCSEIPSNEIIATWSHGVNSNSQQSTGNDHSAAMKTEVLIYKISRLTYDRVKQKIDFLFKLVYS